MGLEAIVAAAQTAALEGGEDTTEDTTEVVAVEGINLTTGEVVTAIEPTKRQKGRPNIHDWAGRTYLLKKEVDEVFTNPDAFETLMAEKYAISEDRLTEITAAELWPLANTLEVTFSGKIKDTIAAALKMASGYSEDKCLFRISKQKLVPPTHKLYQEPKTETIGNNKKGKPQMKILHQEMNPETCYVYVTISL